MEGFEPSDDEADGAGACFLFQCFEELPVVVAAAVPVPVADVHRLVTLM